MTPPRWLRFRRSIPIFVISYNRGEMLRQVVASYQGLSDRIEVIVHDNGSDDPTTIEILHELMRQGVMVKCAGKAYTASDLDSVNETVCSYFGGAPASCYVVTDCDVDMSIAEPDALAIYGELLDQFPVAECVGPMLRIRDIPREYPLFNWVIERHHHFWDRPPQWTKTSAGRTAILFAPIDTTFALHRRAQPFRRLKEGIRVHFPYEARHLDWYLSSTEVSAGSYQLTSSEEISHWNNIIQRRAHRDDPSRSRQIIYVERDAGGGLTTKRLALT